MSDTTDEAEAGAGLYENYLEEEKREELRERRKKEEDILIKKIDRRIEIAKPKCICNEGLHDGKRVDCSCKVCGCN